MSHLVSLNYNGTAAGTLLHLSLSDQVESQDELFDRKKKINNLLQLYVIQTLSRMNGVLNQGSSIARGNEQWHSMMITVLESQPLHIWFELIKVWFLLDWIEIIGFFWFCPILFHWRFHLWLCILFSAIFKLGYFEMAWID